MIRNLWSTLARLLIVVALLAAFTLAAGVACGDGEAEDSRSSRSDDRDSSSDRNDEDEEEDEDRDSSRSRTNNSSESRSPRRSGDGVSLEGLNYLPNLEFTEILMIDATTYFSGDLPSEIEAVVDDLYEEYWTRYGESLVTNDMQNGVISSSEVDTVIVLIHDDHDFGTALLGSYDPDTVRKALNDSDQHQPFGREELGYVGWQATENYNNESAILSNDQYYIHERIEGFTQALADGLTMLDNPENPTIRAMEKAGPGWLVVSLEGADYCRDLRVDLDEDACLSMAFAASSRSRSTIEATWVILFDSEENASMWKQAIEDVQESSENLPDILKVPWISRLETDGEFIVATGTLNPEEAVELMDEFGFEASN